jgi:hypothetical protein
MFAGELSEDVQRALNRVFKDVFVSNDVTTMYLATHHKSQGATTRVKLDAIPDAVDPLLMSKVLRSEKRFNGSLPEINIVIVLKPKEQAPDHVIDHNLADNSLEQLRKQLAYVVETQHHGQVHKC